jgi:hypothetical protein
MSPDDALEIYDAKAMRFEREIAPSQVYACLPQIAHARAQHFSRREPLRREIREQDVLDRIRAEAAAARGAHDEWPQSIDARRSSDDAAGVRREERPAEGESRILGNRTAHRCCMGGEGESRCAALGSHLARRLDPNALDRVRRPQHDEAGRDEGQAGQEHKRLQHANCRARTRKAESDLGQRNPFLGNSGR